MINLIEKVAVSSTIIYKTQHVTRVFCRINNEVFYVALIKDRDYKLLYKEIRKNTCTNS